MISRYHVDFELRGGMTFQRLTIIAQNSIISPNHHQMFVLFKWAAKTCAKDHMEKLLRTFSRMRSFHMTGFELLRRQPWATRPGYNGDVATLNENMASLENIHFWPHRCFWSDLSYLRCDGVHIDGSLRHMKKYLNSIRSAVFYHS